MSATWETRNLEVAVSFVRAVGAMDSTRLEQFFTPDVEQREMPNAFKPAGQTRDLSTLMSDMSNASGIISEQSYDIIKTVASDQTVILEMVWHGMIAADLPKLKKGQTLRAHCVAIFEFRDGKIVKLRNYDCFDPL